MRTDKYFVSADLNSSFVFSGVSVGGGVYLYKNIYGTLTLNGIYHFFNEDKSIIITFSLQAVYSAILP